MSNHSKPTTLCIIMACLALMISVSTAATATVIYVSTNGNDNNNGLSWATAKKTVTAGINAATSGDEVWVAKGTYYERITLKSGVKLYGGFAGTETSLSQRPAFPRSSPDSNETILDGSYSGSVVTSPSGASSATRIDGFTIRNGNAGGGGGIRVNSGSPVIANNTIKDNSASNGGGIYCASDSCTIVNNIIKSNIVMASGAGIYCAETSSVIANNFITNNSATSWGGGIYCDGGTTLIANNTITQNYADSGGGGICFSFGGSTPTVNNIVVSNSSGIRVQDVAPPIRNNCVWNNTAYNYSGMSDPTGTNGNISQNPKLTDGIHIASDSPCIDAGDNSVVQTDWVDYDGEQRIMSTHVDIGADEYTQVSVVATPTFNPDGGTFTSTISVTVSCATSGATIRYTTNGNDPTESDPVIASGGTVNITQTTILKAKAWKSGMTPSAVKSATYTLQVALPSFYPDGGSHGSTINVTVSCATPGATIRYTTNGNDPTESDPVVASGGTINITQTTTLKAKAWKTGWSPSGVKSATYQIQQVETPTFNPDGGSFPSAVNVTISCATPGATIRYTTNGNDPTESDTVIASGGTVTITQNTVLKAKAWKSGLTPSVVKSATYVILQVAKPAFNPDGGSYDTEVTVTVTCATPGATIRYTVNGNDPTEEDPIIASGGTVNITETTTLKARAWKEGLTPSNVKSANYYILQVATPTFEPDAGIYTEAVTVTIKCATPGATIRYTTNGNDPTESDPVVASGGTVNITQTTTLKARAWKEGLTPSAIKSAGYIIQPTQVATPWFYPDGGFYQSQVAVEITCATPGAVIRYTTNGNDPTESDPTIASGGTIDITQTTTLKARAWKTGWEPSAVKTAVYNLQVAMPGFNPDGGTFSSPVAVTVTCVTPGATIRYTTNGNNPTESDPVVVSGGTVNITQTTTLKARAWKTGLDASDIKSATYTFQVDTPTFDPDGGVFGSPVQVVIACATPGATIRYTTNGNDPTVSDPAIPSGGTVNITQTTTLKAKAWKEGLAPSTVKSATYTIQQQVSTPTFNPDAGTFVNQVNVTISCDTPGATIRYTTNGNDPTENDAVIASGGTINITQPTTLKAKAWKTGMTPSAVKSATYNFQVATPTFNPDGGNFPSAISVTISCATPGATIRYTTNGNDPTETDPTIASGGSINITQNTVLKAKAWKSGFIESSVKSATYVIGSNEVSMPSFDPDGGTYSGTITVTISCSTPGATIHYTTNGNDPTENDPTIESGYFISISETTVLKAKAWKKGMTPSAVKTATYTIQQQVATPTFNPDGGTYLNQVNVVISCTTPGATIRYTTNGKDPTENDTIIASGGSVLITQDTALKAKAWKTGMTPSAVKSAAYTIQQQVIKPTFEPDGGIYPGPINVIVSCDTPGATIRYTTNGNDPTESDPTIASGGTILINQSTILKAKAWKTGMIPSAVKTAEYSITGAGKRLHVKQDGSDTNDGLSWATAKKTITAALSSAVSGDEIWVKGNPSLPYTGTLTLKNGVSVYGGFVGTETSLSQRPSFPRPSPDANESVLNAGGATASVVTIPASVDTCRLDGFTIINGRGGIRCSGGGNVTITNSKITANTATYGGGIYCDFSSAIITNNVITGNTANSEGGGIYLYSGSPTITGNTISGNSSNYGGGISCYGGSALISWNTISGNNGGYGGGGIECYGGSPIIANNVIKNNTLLTGGFGGGIYCEHYGSPMISGNIIAGNSATAGGGVACDTACSPRLTNNTIVSNTAATGGGISSNWDSSPIISNNAVAFNSSGIASDGTGSPLLRNNCVYNPGGSNYSGVSPGVGDFSADPLFVDKNNGDYHLTIQSPCINAGWNDAPGLPETDIDGESRINAGVVDVGADEYTFPAGETTIQGAKLAANNSWASITGAIVYGAFTNFFYIEANDRSSGIRVQKAAHGMSTGMRANVVGQIKTNTDGEKYMEAVSVTYGGSGTVKPIAMNNRAIGGSDLAYNPVTGAGQKGVKGGIGLNNIGLLVTTWGVVTEVSSGSPITWFKIDDGSGVGVKVAMPSGASMDILVGDRVLVSGASSCEKVGNDLVRVIRIRSTSDIVVF